MSVERNGVVECLEPAMSNIEPLSPTQVDTILVSLDVTISDADVLERTHVNAKRGRGQVGDVEPIHLQVFHVEHGDMSQQSIGIIVEMGLVAIAVEV